MSTFHTTVETETLMFICGLNAPDMYPHFSGFEDSFCLEECLPKPIFALKPAQSESVTTKLPMKLLLHLCHSAESCGSEAIYIRARNSDQFCHSYIRAVFFCLPDYLGYYYQSFLYFLTIFFIRLLQYEGLFWLTTDRGLMLWKALTWAGH